MHDEYENESDLDSGLDDLISEAAQEKEQAEKEANEPTQEESEAARAMAEKLNAGFLIGVDKFICPSVDLFEHVDGARGVDALTPLCEQFGGEAPAWITELTEKYAPYIGAGLYVGTTIYQARKLELMAVQMDANQTEGGAKDAG